MSKVRQVYPPDEVAHLWANQRQDSARNSGKTMYFNSDVIYSYGSHYIIGALHDNNLVLVNSSRYSSSTNKHRNYVISTVNHKQRIYCSHPFRERDLQYSKKECIVPNVKTWVIEIQSLIEKQKKAKSRNYLIEVEKVFDTLIEFLDVFDGYSHIEDWLSNWIKVYKNNGVTHFYPLFTELDQVRIDILNKKKAKEEKRREEVRLEHVKSAKKALSYWKNNKPFPRGLNKHYFQHLKDTYLRVDTNGDVETSKGIVIKRNKCDNLWKLITSVRIDKEGVIFGEYSTNIIYKGKYKNTGEFKINGYNVDYITPKGDLFVGCHNIHYLELKNIAKKLNL